MLVWSGQGGAHSRGYWFVVVPIWLCLSLTFAEIVNRCKTVADEGSKNWTLKFVTEGWILDVFTYWVGKIDLESIKRDIYVENYLFTLNIF